jgi:hypothetical protein
MSYICVLGVSIFPLPAVLFYYILKLWYFFIFILLCKRKWMIHEVIRDNKYIHR